MESKEGAPSGFGTYAIVANIVILVVEGSVEDLRGSVNEFQQFWRCEDTSKFFGGNICDATLAKT